MASTDIGLIIFLIAVLSIGYLLSVVALVDILNYRDLQRARFAPNRERK